MTGEIGQVAVDEGRVKPRSHVGLLCVVQTPNEERNQPADVADHIGIPCHGVIDACPQ